MIIPDVNVIVGALQPDAQHHSAYANWLESTLRGPEALGLSELVLSGAVRILTHPGIFVRPLPAGQVLDSLATLRSVATRVRAGSRHWSLFDRLCREVNASGNLVPDAYHAALALEHGASFATSDKGFRRFSELAIVDPLSR